MAKKSRTKGAAGERECARLLQEIFALAKPPQRILSQYQESGLPDFSIDTVGGVSYAVEVKRRRSFTMGELESFWIEAVDQAGDYAIPLLAYRADRQPWLFRAPAYFLQASARLLPMDEHWVELTAGTLRAIVGPSDPAGGVLQ